MEDKTRMDKDIGKTSPEDKPLTSLDDKDDENNDLEVYYGPEENGSTGERRRRKRRFWLCLGMVLVALVIILSTIGLFVCSMKSPHATTSPNVSSLTSNSTFTLTSKLYPILTNETRTNVVTSVYGLTSLLSLVLAGSSGNIEQEIKGAFALNDHGSEHNLFDEHKEMSAFLDDSHLTPKTSSNIFFRDGINLLGPYLHQVRDMSGMSAAEVIDFAKINESISNINSGMPEVTKERLKDLMAQGSVKADAKIVLASVLYFNGTWESSFNVTNTSLEDFHVSQTEKFKVKMMKRSGPYSIYSNKDLGCQILELPYKGDRLAMYLFLSNTPEGFAGMEGNFSRFNFSELQWKHNSRVDWKTRFNEETRPRVEIQVPRFRVDTTVEWSVPLKRIMVTSMFDQDVADFSRMTGHFHHNLNITAVLQKSIIDVNEIGGSEEATKTGGNTKAHEAFTMTQDCPGECVVSPTLIKFDRPFLFAVLDTATGTVLYRGRIVDPTMVSPVTVDWADKGSNNNVGG